VNDSFHRLRISASDPLLPDDENKLSGRLLIIELPVALPTWRSGPRPNRPLTNDCFADFIFQTLAIFRAPFMGCIERGLGQLFQALKCSAQIGTDSLEPFNVQGGVEVDRSFVLGKPHG
jgi:hypothetical protein